MYFFLNQVLFHWSKVGSQAPIKSSHRSFSCLQDTEMSGQYGDSPIQGAAKLESRACRKNRQALLKHF